MKQLFTKPRIAATRPLFSGGLPVVAASMVAGVLGYFALPVEPNLLLVAGLSILVALLAGISWRWWSFRGGVLLGVLALSLLGATYATWRTHLVHTQFWAADDSGASWGVYWLSGTLESTRDLPDSPVSALTLRNVTVYSQPPTAAPRLTVFVHTSRLSSEDAVPGAQIAAQARISPPGVPLYPGAQIDWRRQSFFRGEVGSGLVMGEFYATRPYLPTWQYRLQHWREQEARQLATHGPAGGVLAALLTGVRTFIPAPLRQAYRQSGLAHLMAISGMHLGMLAAAVYLLARLLLCLWSPLPLRYDIRKPAAVLAIGATLAYAAMAGGSIPTLRATAMVIAIFLGILTNRLHLSVRILSLAALGLLLWRPQVVAGPSFLLSFAAALALITWAHQRRQWQPEAGQSTSLGYKLKTLMAVSVTATLATAPIAAWFFGTVALAGVLANMVAIPLLGLLILPFGFLGLLFGPAFTAVALAGTHVLNSWATWCAHLPLSSFQVTGWQVWLVIPVAGFCLWGWLSRRYVLVVPGLALLPLFMLLPEASPVAVQLPLGAGVLKLEQGRYQAFGPVSEVYAYQVKKLQQALPAPAKPDPQWACDAGGCSWQGITLLADIPTAEDCGLSRVLLGPVTQQECPAAVRRPNQYTGAAVFADGHVRYYQLPHGRPWQQF